MQNLHALNDPGLVEWGEGPGPAATGLQRSLMQDSEATASNTNEPPKGEPQSGPYAGDVIADINPNPAQPAARGEVM